MTVSNAATFVVFICGSIVAVVAGGVVGQSNSSSGQSWTPLHQRFASIQISEVGQRIWASGHGLQMQPQVVVTDDFSPAGHLSQDFFLHCGTPPSLHKHWVQSGPSYVVPTGYFMWSTTQGHCARGTQCSPFHHSPLAQLHMRVLVDGDLLSCTPGQVSQISLGFLEMDLPIGTPAETLKLGFNAT